MRRARDIALAALALIVTAFAGCTGLDEPDVTLWHAYRGAEADALHEVIRAFERDHAEIRVEVVPVPYSAYANKISSGVPRGNGPDVFLFAQERIGAWAESGVLRPIDGLLPPHVLEPIPDALVEAVRYDGRTWGVPLATKTTALFYHRGHLAALGAEPPATTEEMLALAARFNDPGAGRFGLVYPVDDFYFHSGWLFGFGGSIKRPDGFPRLSSPENAASLRWAASLRNDRALLPRDAEYAVAVDRFGSGNALFAVNGPWFRGEIGDTDYGVVPLPIVSESGRAAAPFVTVESALVTTQVTPDRERAVTALLAHLGGVESATVRARVAGQVVTHPAAYADEAVAADPILRAFADAAAAGVSMPNTPPMQAIWEPSRRALQRVLRSGADPVEALAEADREIAIALAPPPPPARLEPFLAVMGVLLLGAAAWAVRRARQTALVSRVRAARTAYSYVLPAAVASVLLLFVPFVVGASLSLFTYEAGSFRFVGVANFVSILTSSDRAIFEPRSFWFTLVVTVLWTASNVALHVGIGLGLAMLLRDPWVKLRGVWRVLLIVPWAIPNYITALVWKSMFNFNFGAINGILRAIGVEPVDWFSSWATAFTANLTTNTWLGFPFMMVVSLGALQSIPRDLEDAAEVDGASRWQRFRHVTLPLLRPALVPAIVLGTVWTFNMFNIIYLVSGGGPDSSTDILITEAYRWAFERGEQYGYAAAYGLLIFGVLLIYTWATTGRAVGEVSDAT